MTGPRCASLGTCSNMSSLCSFPPSSSTHRAKMRSKFVNIMIVGVSVRVSVESR